MAQKCREFKSWPMTLVTQQDEGSSLFVVCGYGHNQLQTINHKLQTNFIFPFAQSRPVLHR